MFKRCFFVAVIVCMPVLAWGFDCTNWYLRGFGGLNYLSGESISEMSWEMDVGYAFGGAVGYRFLRTVRIEGEVTYRHNDSADAQVGLVGCVSSLVFMGNILFAFPVNWALVPYFGAGLGKYYDWGNASVINKAETLMEAEFKRWGFGYQAILGLNILCFQILNVGINYHFFDSLVDSERGHDHTLVLTCSKTF